MAVERLIRRTAWTAKCQCGETDIRENWAPRSRFCPQCKVWNDYVKEEWIGPDRLDGR